jgi:hypothetical protein
MTAPKLPEGLEPVARYSVKKESGSNFAYVMDAVMGHSVKRYDIFKADGWAKADRHCAHLNAAIDSALLAEKEAKQ